MWQEKSLTCDPHFGSSLFVVNDRLCVAGGHVATTVWDSLCDKQATVEVYDEENNKWSVVEENHIPQNNLGAMEIEGKVYSSSINFQLTVVLGSHQGRCVR